jgi:hypothetical protein
MNLAEIIAVALLGAEAPVLAVLIVRWVRRRQPRPPARMDAAVRRLQEDVRRMGAELQGLAEDIDRRLDERLQQLNETIACCEARIDELRALAAAPTGEQSPASADPPEAAGAPDPPDEDEKETPSQYVGDGEIARLADEGLPAFEIARRLGRQVGEVELAVRLLRAGRGETQAPSPKS